MNVKEAYDILRESMELQLVYPEPDEAKALSRARIWQEVLAQTPFAEAHARLLKIASNERRDHTLHPGALVEQDGTAVNRTGAVEESRRDREEHRQRMLDPEFVRQLDEARTRAFAVLRPKGLAPDA